MQNYWTSAEAIHETEHETEHDTIHETEHDTLKNSEGIRKFLMQYNSGGKMPRTHGTPF